ncbi:MAG TPA: hypothetical protein VJ798_13760 [Rhizomicrobium sp.]|nr:hypothetical protein [Rhizomicrobium sp.]
MTGVDPFGQYLLALRKKPIAEKTEHTDRSALETLLNHFASAADGKPQVQHEPKRITGKGAPDFKVTKAGLILGYVENKAIGENLSKVLKSEQITKYKSLSQNLLLTDYLEFVWIGKGGVQRETLCHEADLEDRKARLREDRVAAVAKLLQGFFSTAPEGLAGRSNWPWRWPLAASCSEIISARNWCGRKRCIRRGGSLPFFRPSETRFSMN